MRRLRRTLRRKPKLRKQRHRHRHRRRRKRRRRRSREVAKTEAGTKALTGLAQVRVELNRGSAHT